MGFAAIEDNVLTFDAIGLAPVIKNRDSTSNGSGIYFQTRSLVRWIGLYVFHIEDFYCYKRNMEKFKIRWETAENFIAAYIPAIGIELAKSKAKDLARIFHKPILDIRGR